LSAVSRVGLRRGGLGWRRRRRFGVAPATAVRLARRKAETGSVAPSRQGRPAGSGRLAAHVATLIGWVEADGDITMPELAAQLLAEKAVTVHPASLSRYLRVQGFSFKKKRCWRAKPIALMSSVPDGYGPNTASHG